MKPVIRRTKAVTMHGMDLSSGAREFANIEDEREEEDYYRSMTWKEKALYQIKHW
jgi:amino acid transporter